METGTVGTQGAAATAAAADGTNAAAGEGNDGLSQAFDEAIAQAQQTLETTTVKGADLYALKQSVR